MLYWFVDDPARLDHERKALESLATSSEWLNGYEWKLGTGIEVIATVSAHGEEYELRAVFPMLFPDAPIEVYPVGENARLSTHQYGGADGALCLEYGPDNWDRSITCAMMIESARRLLEIENPRGEHAGTPVIAPSRHHLTIGQEVRSHSVRWYLSPGMAGFLADAGPRGTLEFSFRKLGASFAVLLHGASSASGEKAFSDDAIPNSLPNASGTARYRGVWFITDLPRTNINAVKTESDLQKLCAEANVELSASGNEVESRELSGVLLRDSDGDYHFFLVFDAETVIRCATVTSDMRNHLSRSPRAASFFGKRIAIVGLGSVGSKAAASLARMGAESFLLMDHDVFLPENIARHTLDWWAVTQHKADGVAEHLKRINARVSTETSLLYLTGQESNKVVNTAFDKLAACDAILDATGDGRSLNVLSSIAVRAKIPFVWVQVFAGGVGGFVARSRPGVDASPRVVRATYDEYCRVHPAPEWMHVAEDYTGRDNAGEPLVADDAEVSIIAHHAARYVQDCFNPPPGLFPYQLYLVGMASEWVFAEPFSVIPLGVDASADIAAASDEGDPNEGIDFVASLIQGRNGSITGAE